MEHSRSNCCRVLGSLVKQGQPGGHTGGSCSLAVPGLPRFLRTRLNRRGEFQFELHQEPHQFWVEEVTGHHTPFSLPAAPHAFQ
ncbi:hypothetical protein GHT09_002622 [Marmota monax]|uniref:Uncharacterized protein n=1 Tax=Marmota monax TaxID=9995 RepID=A0A834QVV2_MARMO|nr:hypothetical protein GHT09_002622 [Marmota monax]